MIVGTTTAAQWLRVTPARVRQLLIAGELKGTKLGRDWMIESEDIQQYHENGQRKKGPRS